MKQKYDKERASWGSFMIVCFCALQNTKQPISQQNNKPAKHQNDTKVK